MGSNRRCTALGWRRTTTLCRENVEVKGLRSDPVLLFTPVELLQNILLSFGVKWDRER